MIEEQRKVLKFMSEVTGRMDVNAFAEKMGLTVNETIDCVQELAKEGFVRKVGTGYAMTEKARTTLKASDAVPAENSFQFYTDMNQPTGLNAASIQEFYEAILKVDFKSVEFHVNRDDFENWIRETIKDEELAEEIAKTKQSDAKGEELREEIAKAIQTRYNL
ncbi:MAG: DUF5752 family protein [Candidatus Bathyarchaeota archaeon]|nr:DUF5752 family protein [Candidatus Bathyarchaeota archaeon]